MRFSTLLNAVIAAALFYGCSATVPIRSLPSRSQEITGSIGGPFIELGSSNIPLPYMSVGYFVGATNDVTLGASVHLIPAVLGDAIVDATALYRIHKQTDLPEITASLQLGLMSDLRLLRSTRFIPTIGINASQEIGSRTICFVGFENTIQIASPSYIFSPYLGARHKFSDGFALTLEGKWMAVNVNTAHGVMEGAGSVDDHGDIGIFLGMEFGL